MDNKMISNLTLMSICVRLVSGLHGLMMQSEQFVLITGL